MSSSKRYFTNNLNDSVGAPINVPKDPIKSQCLKYIQHIFSHQTVTNEDCDGGLYVGLAGVSYMFYYMAQHPDFAQQRQEFLEKSLHYLKRALSYVEEPRSKSSKAAFLLGAGGTYAVASAVMIALRKDQECDLYLQKYVSLADSCVDQDYLGCGSDEMLVGRAGYLCGALFLQGVFGRQIVPEEKIFALCAATIDSGLKYSKKYKSPSPLMYSYYDTEYLGTAHGLSGILQMLISFPNYLDKNPDAERKVKESVDYLLGLQTPSGNFPCSMDEVKKPRSESNELVHWCHGAPGVVYLMAKAYLRWKEEKYLQSCLACGEITWNKGLLKKGPGICHGIAGSGYVFLLLYRLTNHNKHLQRALKFAEFLSSDEFKHARTPDCPLSLYEGLAGTVCFLADLVQTEKAHFPFYDVF